MSDYSSNFNNITALQKARQVAAKLQLAGPNKRLHEDDDHEPHSKRFGGSNSSSMSPAHLQQAQQAAAQVAARLGQPPSYQNQAIPNPEAVEKAKQLINKFIPQSQGLGGNGSGGGGSMSGGGNSNSNNQPQRPGLGANNYTEIMVPGSKVGLIIGKGGLTIKQLQERTGAKMVVIQDGPDQEMEKPLRISGDPQKVEHAKQLVYELIQDKGNDGQQQSNNSNNRNNYNNSNQDHGAAYSSGNGGRNGGNGGDQIEVFVPKAAVGVVIGKEGGMIKKIQADTGCKLQFLQTKSEGPGDRRCIVQGTKQQVDDGKRMIEDLIDSVLRRNNNSGGGGGGNDNWNNNGSNSGGYQQHSQHQQSQAPMAGGIQVVQQQYEFTVPTSKCGIIIGRGGDTIKQINQQSGAHCEMDRKKSASQTNEKTFSIKGEQHQIDEAKRLIQDKINMDVDLQHLGSTTVTQQANGYGQNAQNPYQSWGAGGGGASGYNQGGWDQNQAAAAGQMPGQQVMGAAAGANQPDYSLQWIEYYRSMGMHQQADAIEAQIKARQTTGAGGAPVAMQGGNPAQQQQQPQAPGASAPSGQPQDGGAGQRDYSQEWANYYRQIGKIEEAEAIERQIKGSQGGSTNNNASANSQQQPNFPGPNYQQQPQQQYQQFGQYGANYQQYQQPYHGNGQNSNNDKNW